MTRDYASSGADATSYSFLRMARNVSTSRRQTSEQRREVRRRSLQVGNYLKSTTTEESVQFDEGPATVLNQSTHGMLLRMSKPFNPGGILEVTFKDSKNAETTTVLQVCWSKPIRRGGRVHLIGCRRLLAGLNL